MLRFKNFFFKNFKFLKKWKILRFNMNIFFWTEKTIFFFYFSKNYLKFRQYWHQQFDRKKSVSRGYSGLKKKWKILRFNMNIFFKKNFKFFWIFFFFFKKWFFKKIILNFGNTDTNNLTEKSPFLGVTQV